MIKITLPFDTTDATLELVGGKGRSLSEMTRAGLPVPPGFHITTDAYRAFVSENDLQTRILNETTRTPDDASANIAAMFAEVNISSEIVSAIQAAYADLGGSVPVAVRSSANAEDLPDMSFAGQPTSVVISTRSDED